VPHGDEAGTLYRFKTHRMVSELRVREMTYAAPVVLVDYAAEHLPPLNWQAQRTAADGYLRTGRGPAPGTPRDPTWRRACDRIADYGRIPRQ
jgi:hypothetical protein